MTHYSYLKTRRAKLERAAEEMRASGFGEAATAVYEFEITVVDDLIASERAKMERDAVYVLGELIAHQETITPHVLTLLVLITGLADQQSVVEAKTAKV